MRWRATCGEALVGRRGMALLGSRFPLIVKLIDAADWLSLQVHPTTPWRASCTARAPSARPRPGSCSRPTPDAELVTGPADDLDEPGLRAAIAAGTTSGAST